MKEETRTRISAEYFSRGDRYSARECMNNAGNPILLFGRAFAPSKAERASGACRRSPDMRARAELY